MSAPPRLPTIAAYPLPGAGELPPARAPWRLQPERAALLVHDMQEYFAAAFPMADSPLAPMVANIARLLAAARRRGLPVFYTAQRGNQERRDRGLQADLWGPGMRHLPEDERILPALAPAAGDRVLEKHRYSAFQRSNLAALLRARGLNQLIICGVYAHIGCQLTAAEAFQRDIEPFLVADALGDFSRPWHDAALHHVADCLGVVCLSQEIVETLDAQ